MKGKRKKKKQTKSMLLKLEKRRQKRELKRRIEEWKLKIIARDKCTCQFCSKQLLTRKECHPHHIISEMAVKRKYPFLIDDLNNGILLCYYCHKAAYYSAHQGGFEFTFLLKKKRPELYFYLTAFLEKSSIDYKAINTQDKDNNNPK